MSDFNQLNIIIKRVLPSGGPAALQPYLFRVSSFDVFYTSILNKVHYLIYSSSLSSTAVLNRLSPLITCHNQLILIVFSIYLTLSFSRSTSSFLTISSHLISPSLSKSLSILLPISYLILS